MEGPAAAQKHIEIRDIFILLNLTTYFILDSSSTLRKIGGDAEEVFIFQNLDINFKNTSNLDVTEFQRKQ